jgi:acyl carrier protein
MSRREIENLIIALLAEIQGKDPETLRSELEAAGEKLPIDSLLVVEILVQVQEVYGVDLPANVESAKNLATVTSFAQAILDEFRKTTAANGPSE